MRRLPKGSEDGATWMRSEAGIVNIGPCCAAGKSYARLSRPGAQQLGLHLAAASFPPPHLPPENVPSEFCSLKLTQQQMMPTHPLKLFTKHQQSKHKSHSKIFCTRISSHVTQEAKIHSSKPARCLQQRSESLAWRRELHTSRWQT